MSKTVLLVDDSRTALMLQKMMLAKTGFEVLTATDGRAAIDLAKQRDPDLIVMDVMMPKLNGIDAVRHLRADPNFRDTPIIMVTTRSEAFSVNEGYAAGCTDYMTKPFNGAELVAKINRHLGFEDDEVEARSTEVRR